MSEAMDQIKHTADEMENDADKADGDSTDNEDVKVEGHTEHSETEVEKSGDDAKDALSS